MPTGKAFRATESLISDLDLHTVCRSAKCPNAFECFSKNVATFLIMGDVCTRNCAFCNIATGRPAPLDPSEPERLAEAASRLNLRHTVVTSVTRDDLPDGGAAHYTAVIRALRDRLPKSGVEVLIPDFQGDEQALAVVLEAGPDVLNHNVETVPSLYSRIRPQADYRQSLDLLARVRRLAPGVVPKSGLMTGLGEELAQVKDVIRDMAGAGVGMVTIGQYMRPSVKHPPVRRWMPPEEFEELAEFGRGLGIPTMFCGPKVRSSYNAAEFAGNEPPANK